MKIAIQFLAAAFILMTVSCKSIDKEFLTKMKSDMTSMEAVGEQLNNLGSSMSELKTAVDTAPDALKNNAESGYGALVEQLTGAITTQGSMSNQFSQMMDTFKGLITEYASGKIKTAAAKTKLGELTEGFGGIQSGLGALSSTISDLTTNFGQMTAPYKEAMPAGK